LGLGDGKARTVTGPVCTLVVMARAPVAGQVKTRLWQGEAAAGLSDQRALSAAEAAQLHAAFIADVCSNGVQAGFARLRLYVASSDVDAMAPAAWATQLAQGYTLHAQQGADLGARMEHALRTELAQGAQAVIIVGTDSPTLPVRYLQEARAQLTGGATQVVLGPASDGGYYLIGASQPVPELFADGMKWGTSSVLATTLQRLREHQQQHPQLRCHLLPFFYDVDTPSDLRLLREHLQFSQNKGRLGDGSDALGQEISAPQTWALLGQLGLTSS
jgi:rSAM/selenodomain-associated transferase 1